MHNQDSGPSRGSGERCNSNIERHSTAIGNRVDQWRGIPDRTGIRSVEEQSRVIAGRSLPIGAAMIAEREHLLPLVDEGFDLASLHFPQINASGCVRY